MYKRQIAHLAGLPSVALIRTLGAIRSAESCPFGRDFSETPALTDELYAIRVTGALFHTQGGLTVDADARVTDPDGVPFPNLWAGGGAACGVSGPRVEGYLSGNGLLTAIGLGWLAGRSAGRQVAG